MALRTLANDIVTAHDTLQAQGVEIPAWLDAPAPKVRLCPTRTPEPHQRGEFPMTCYQCHMEADS